MNYLKGLEQEKIMKPIIEDFFSLQLTHGARYDLFDFYDENNYIELKCRNCYSYSYKDLMMNIPKWNEGYKFINFNKSIYYVFKFIDGIFYHKQSHDDNFEIRKYNSKDYIFIPTDKLLKLSKKDFN